MDLQNKPKQQPDYQLEEMDGELLLYHLNQTKILYCNQSASLIWQLCSGEHTIDEIIAMLSAAFPNAAASMADEVTATLQQFLDGDAIELV